MIDTRADRRLLDYRPELELPATDGEAAPWRDEYGEMDFAARLLEDDLTQRIHADLARVGADGLLQTGRNGAKKREGTAE